MAAPAIGSQSAAGGNVSTLTLNKPADAASDALVGEMCYATISLRNTISVSTVPTGWTLVTSITSGASTLLFYRHKYVVGDPASWSWELSSQERSSGNIFTVTGALTTGTNGADSVDVFDELAGLTTPSIITTVADTTILSLYGVFHSSFGATATLSTPADTTLITRFQTTNNACESNYETQASAGATTARTATTNTSSGKTSIAVAIRAPDAGGVTLTLEDLAQSQSLDAVVVTQKHTLAVADLLQAHTLDAVTLTQKHSLLVADTQQAQLLDSISISQKHVLILADLAQSHSLDNVVLTHKHVLAIADALQTNTLDNIVLTQKQLLVVEDLLQSQLLDAIVLVSEELADQIGIIIKGAAFSQSLAGASATNTVSGATSSATIENEVT